jgi:ferric-dicitrate binding protein FerR (iron transport regulator)
MNEPGDDILKQFGFGDDEQLRKALSELDKLKTKPLQSKAEAWAKFEQSVVSRDNTKPKSNLITVGLVWKVAASILVLIAVWMGFNTWTNVTCLTANNQTREVILPDHSTVTLNAASTLNYKKFRWNASRQVELSGEALFKVTKGSSFEIFSLGKTITVLGTEFNVFSRENYFEVKCISGKVAVQIPGTEKIMLTKGTAVKKEHKDKAPVKFDVPSGEASWINGNFYYNDADLNLAFDEIARQFNVTISRNLPDRRYSGYFNKSGLKEALDHVCLPMNLTYNIIKDSVIIKQGF